MIVYKTNNNPYKQNTFLYYDEQKKKGVVIDPGWGSEEMADFIEKNEIQIEKIFITHFHFDHIAQFHLFEKFTKETYSSSLEKEQLKDPNQNGTNRYLKNPVSVTCKAYLNEGDFIKFLDTGFKVIITPGHSHGHICYYDEKNGILFSGDTLFKEGVGRTDLPFSSPVALESSIQNKLYILPDETICYPGHDDNKTTIGHEKKNNPYVKG